MASIVGVIIFVLFIDRSAQFRNKDKILCFTAAQKAVQDEPDMQVRKVMTETLETVAELAVDIVLELNEEQVARTANYYFGGPSCGDVRSLFEDE